MILTALNYSFLLLHDSMNKLLHKHIIKLSQKYKCDHAVLKDINAKRRKQVEMRVQSHLSINYLSCIKMSVKRKLVVRAGQSTKYGMLPYTCVDT